MHHGLLGQILKQAHVEEDEGAGSADSVQVRGILLSPCFVLFLATSGVAQTVSDMLPVLMPAKQSIA